MTITTTKPGRLTDNKWWLCEIGQHDKCATEIELSSRFEACPCECHQTMTTQPAPDAGEWLVECQLVKVTDPPRGRVVVKDVKTLRIIACEDNPSRWDQALIDFEQIVTDHTRVAKLEEALRFVDAFFQNLEESGDENDPLTTARRRYHAPVRKRIADALTTTTTQPDAGEKR